MIGQLFQTSLENNQLEVGSFAQIFQLLFEDYIQLTSPTWMSVLWEFVGEHDVNSSHNYSPRIVPLRVNDKALMDIFTQDHYLTATVKMSINKARGCLEVVTLEDVSTSDCTKIRPCFSSGLKSDTKSN